MTFIKGLLKLYSGLGTSDHARLKKLKKLVSEPVASGSKSARTTRHSSGNNGIDFLEDYHRMFKGNY
jgi:hypothetical protein